MLAIFHFARNTSSNVHIHSTNFETTRDFNKILTNFIYLLSIFHTKAYVHSFR